MKESRRFQEAFEAILLVPAQNRITRAAVRDSVFGSEAEPHIGTIVETQTHI